MLIVTVYSHLFVRNKFSRRRRQNVAKKLYTIKDIVELLNENLEKNEQPYRYTEQNVRSRLRYLRSKGVEEHEEPIITPKVFGYDRRTKYYTEEDVEKLRAILIGPMLPEFDEHEEDLSILEEIDEVEVRPANIEDLEAIGKMSDPNYQTSGKNLHDPVYRMLKEPNSKVFVAINSEEQIIGWVQARISFAISITNHAPAGTIYLDVLEKKSERFIAARSLVYRAHRWLIRRDAEKIYLEMPSQLAELEDPLRNLTAISDAVSIIRLS
jgi:hypothetical protein